MMNLAYSESRAERYNIEEFKLDNGMRVIINYDNSSNIASHNVVYNVGGLQDPNGKAGIAHFLEHLMFKSTKNYKEGDLTSFFNNNGVVFNAGTGYEMTIYYETFVSNLLEDMMRFESDRMQNLIFNENEINIERDVIKEERRMRIDNSLLGSFMEKLQSIHYDNSYYGASLIGLMTDLDNIKIDDLKNFYNKYYDPSNATLVLTGNISSDYAKSLANKYYAPLVNRISNIEEDRDISKIHDLIKTKVENRYYFDLKSKKATSPTYVQIFSAPTLRTHDLNNMKYALALDILVFLLKEGKGMMFSEFVEKQKISSNLYILYDSFGADLYPLKIILNTKENDQLYQIEEKILDFFKNTIINKITDEEIERAARIIGIDYIYSMDDISSRAQFISYAALIKGIKNPGEFLNQYPKLLFTIKKDDIIKVINDVFLNSPTTIGRIFENKL